jgi:polyphosphate kinase
MTTDNVSDEKMRYFPKELSWLSFNERVLQEAKDPSNPVIERMRFLGIYSNNMDEFFQVRVADVKRRILLSRLPSSEFEDDEALMHQIQEKVIELGSKFNTIYQIVLKDLARHNIHVSRPEDLSPYHEGWLKNYFNSNILQHIAPILISDSPDKNIDLDDTKTYLVVQMISEKTEYAAVEIPVDHTPRFVILPPERTRKHKHIVLLDDIMAYFLNEMFQAFFTFDNICGYSMKLTRDAEYNLDDQVEDGLLDKMSKGLKQRLNSEPVRLVFDAEMPQDMQKMLKKKLGLTNYDAMIPAGRYRNFKDFIGFPNVGRNYLENKSLAPLKSSAFARHSSAFDAISEQDILLYYPYHSFNHMAELVRQAAFDPRVSQIKINIYRVAKDSLIMSSLLNAARNGKKVTVMVELKARFDEEANIGWARTLKDAGIKVIFGIPSLKVHSKLCVIHRRENGKFVRYAHVGTGNFHEKTARVYTDFSLFTKHPDIAEECDNVFRFIEYSYKPFPFKHLLVSPINQRSRINKMISDEVKAAQNGKSAGITLKINNLVDFKLIDELYRAARAGVKIRMIVRGMCALVAGLPKLSENIRVISIVDRFLEHPRVMVFHNQGDTKVFISSADWMTRNMDHRVEVGVPVYDENLKQVIINILDLQFRDRAKARLVDMTQKNSYVKRGNRKKIRSQIAIYDYLKQWEQTQANE